MTRHIALTFMTFPCVLSLCSHAGAGDIRVADSAQLRAALGRAAPGTTLLLEPGVYEGGLYLQNVAGREGAPVVLQGAEPNDPPVFRGGAVALQLSDCSYVTLRHLQVTGFPGNGINIDDGRRGITTP
jgi:hypothetical protein